MERREAQDFISEILAIPHPGELQVLLEGEHRLGTRFSGCAISQNALRRRSRLTLSARIEQKKTSVTLSSIDDPAQISEAIARAFETCRHLPDDDELMPAPGQVIELGEPARRGADDDIDAETAGRWVGEACAAGAAAGIDLAGLLASGSDFTAYGDSAGGFAHERHDRIDFHVTATGKQGSGWAEQQGIAITRDALMAATRRAIDKCLAAQSPQVFEPRPTTVVLEPQAVGDLLSSMAWYGLDQRARDEGRSAFSRFDQRLGRLSLYSDPNHAGFPACSFTHDGQPLGRSTWLDRGELQQLITSRYWAQHKELAAKPSPSNLVLDGDGTPLDELIGGVEDGILVTRFWYIRATDPGTLGFTGMTRDGTYRIEQGRVTHPVVDMRWNQSVLSLLQNVSGSGVPVATGERFPMVMPALRVEDFHFSSLSQ